MSDLYTKDAKSETPMDRLRQTIAWKNDDMKMRSMRTDDLEWILKHIEKLEEQLRDRHNVIIDRDFAHLRRLQPLSGEGHGEVQLQP